MVEVNCKAQLYHWIQYDLALTATAQSELETSFQHGRFALRSSQAYPQRDSWRVSLTSKVATTQVDVTYTEVGQSIFLPQFRCGNGHLKKLISGPGP